MNSSQTQPSSRLRVLIVGGVAAGASAAARARRLSEGAHITIIERGPDVSFANCGLPYHIGGEIADRSRLALHTPESLAELLNVEVRTRTEAVAIDARGRTLALRNLDTGAEETLSYDKLVLAPGAAPLRPPLPGIDNPAIHTLRSLQDMDRIKAAAASARSVLIVGGGFIGLEMVEQLRHLEKQVTLVETNDQVLPQVDAEIAGPIASTLRTHDVELVLGDAAESFAPGKSPAGDAVVTRLKSGREITADMVILSIGVKPENALASAAGLELGARGAIKVNQWMQTSDPDIYAAGDVVEGADRIFGGAMHLALGGPANRQGRVIADHIFLGPEKAHPYPGHIGTAIVRVFDMAAGVTGWTEKRLRQAGTAFESTIVTDHQHAGYYPGATPLTIKLLWSPADGRLLGAQAFGADGVDKRLDVLATALAGRMSIDELAQLELAYAPPFGSARDVVNTAAFTAQNQRDGLVKIVPKITADRHLIDVRPQAVASIDPLPDSTNIPFSDLRSRLGELDAGKKYAVTCSLGKTSYFAARILMQHGFDVVSVAGGLKMSRPVESEKTQPQPATAAPVSKDGSLPEDARIVESLDCTGMSCPGPLLQLKSRMETLASGAELHVTASDPGFAHDVRAFCRSANHELLGVSSGKGIISARIRKTAGASISAPATSSPQATARRKGATVVVFSGEMDKVMASLVIANGAAALGGKVTMFFTFWGLNALRRERPVQVPGKKSLLDRMFSWMLPRGLSRLPLSKMNFGGAGRAMMKHQMATKNLPNLAGLLGSAKMSGVRFVACTMSMEAMGIQPEELIDGVEFGGVADYLDSAELSGTNLFA
ncbi:FAD-dependent oxidoreductase [Ereboglobus luteus]|uniref:Rhodanese domain-containing protein n=1 Tax=Ereboglobus luteus TaxID=1796921 RepID=A0A2U8E1D0_9BACT|nr:FAD-dependent oxidoreductase [Ereboglobus luteus]AWI08679.1 hypothetical protein CKA38_04890 [Ereboglobus luteus]